MENSHFFNVISGNATPVISGNTTPELNHIPFPGINTPTNNLPHGGNIAIVTPTTQVEQNIAIVSPPTTPVGHGTIPMNALPAIAAPGTFNLIHGFPDFLNLNFNNNGFITPTSQITENDDSSIEYVTMSTSISPITATSLFALTHGIQFQSELYPLNHQIHIIQNNDSTNDPTDSDISNEEFLEHLGNFPFNNFHE